MDTDSQAVTLHLAEPAEAPAAAIEQITTTTPASNVPTAEQISASAQELTNLFKDGFQWHDIPQMIQITQSFLAPFPSMTTEEKKASVIQVLSDVIDITDTHSLPDQFSDPVFKALLPPVVDFLLTGNTVSSLTSAISSFESEEAAVEQFAHQLSTNAEWNELIGLVKHAVQYAEQTASQNHISTAMGFVNAVASKVEDISPVFSKIASALITTHFL